MPKTKKTSAQGERVGEWENEGKERVGEWEKGRVGEKSTTLFSRFLSCVSFLVKLHTPTSQTGDLFHQCLTLFFVHLDE